MHLNKSALYEAAAKFHSDSALLLANNKKYNAAAKLFFLGTGFYHIIGDQTSAVTNMLNIAQLDRLPGRVARKIPQEIRDPVSYARQFVQNLTTRKDLSILLDGNPEKLYRASLIHYNTQIKRTKLPRI